MFDKIHYKKKKKRKKNRQFFVVVSIAITRTIRTDLVSGKSKGRDI